MLMNKIGRLFRPNAALSPYTWHTAPVIALLLTATPVVLSSDESSNDPIGNERELISMDLELEEIGIINADGTSPSRVNPTGLTAEMAKEQFRLQQEDIRAEVRQQFCDKEPTQELCSALPNDNTDFSELFVYMFLSQAAQNSFDVFSWQSFVSLNWPVEPTLTDTGSTVSINDTSGGHPLKNNMSLARVWQAFQTPQQLFNPDYVEPICGESPTNSEGNVVNPTLTTSIFLQPTGRPLIDRNLNYLVYDVRVNDVMADYVTTNSLHTMQGQKDFMALGKAVDFPTGFYTDIENRSGGNPGSIAIKTAWKIIDEEAGDDKSRYFTVPGKIPVEADRSETGKPFCIEAELGLVGMHIMRRTESGHGRSWIWSTFEHVDNAPLAENSRGPNAIFSDQLFEGGCKAPSNTGQRYALFSDTCPDCPTNHLPLSNWTWATSPPYAKAFATNSGHGSQVVRCWDNFFGTKLVNEEWQKKLAGTVWANYASTSAQWRGANRGKTLPEGEVPRFLTNTTMETYEQFAHSGSCLSCHAAARSAAGQRTEFSFLLSLLPRYKNQN